MTKKEFKEQCRCETYTGHRTKVNAIFYDWKQGDIDGKYFGGYKYRVQANIKNCNKKELFNILYDWVNKGIHPDVHIRSYSLIGYKYAESDEQRFKIPLSLASE